MPSPHQQTEPRHARRPTALVTGASSGIGLELARVLAREGHDLILVARREATLQDLATDLRNAHGVAVHVIPSDLAQRSAAETLHEKAISLGLHVDILINNAGFGTYGPFAETPPDDLDDMLQVNIVTLTHLTRLFLPGMLEHGRGRVLNVASVAAFVPGPLMAGYYASKAYVLSFSEALANEMKGSGVTVTALCPGPTRSGFQERAGMHAVRFMQSAFMMSAREVAEAGYTGMTQGRAVVIPGFSNRVTAFLPRLTPRSLVTRGIRYVQERSYH